MFWRAVLAASLLAIAAPAQADDADNLEVARRAILRGDFDGAARVLNDVAATPATQNDLDFLRGTIAAGKSDYDEAISRFRALLARDPTLNRVRLDLARAYFLKGDDEAADYQFRAALAQGVPPEVQENVQRFLDQIRQRKRWSIAVSLAIAPDTNINAATTAQSIDLFGLPFELDKTAQRKSGVGLAATISAGYQWKLNDTTKFETGLTYYDTEYRSDAYSDRNLAVYAGPQWLFAHATLAVLATGGKRWFGGDPFTESAGARVEAETTLGPRFGLAGSIAGQYLRYSAGYADYTGPVLSSNVQLTYSPDARSFVRGITGIVREQARIEPLRDTQYVVGVGYYRENLPYALAIYGSVQSAFARYDAPLPAFGRTRSDTEFTYRLSLSDKAIDVLGFTPVISYIHVDRYSNIDLYSYHRNRGEIGISRNF